MADPYPRDLIGYGAHPPDPAWPNGARLAVSFVLNYEEGGEMSVLHGDDRSEVYLQEVPGIPPRLGARDHAVESVYGYGTRAGLWRILRLFERHGFPLTVYAVASALARHPEAARALVAAGHEIASHGLRWIDYQHFAKEDERAHMAEACRLIEAVCGARPVGWYTGRLSQWTLDLVAEDGGFLYCSDAYDDDLPYWTKAAERDLLMIPYTLDVNDMKFGVLNGFATGDDFFRYARDAFECLYLEGAAAPRMMSVGLHLRLIGRPGRAMALARFLDHVASHRDVWVCTRADIARHWRARFTAPGPV